jgi:DNA-binding transcriptional MerR regulator
LNCGAEWRNTATQWYSIGMTETNEPKKLYTIKDLAQELGIGESTVRYYRDAYPGFLAAVIIEGDKNPRYDESAIEILKTIRTLAEEKKSKDFITAELEQKFGRSSQAYIIQQTEQRKLSKDLVPAQMGEFMGVMTDFAQLLRNRQEQDNNELEKLRKERDKWMTKVAELQMLVDSQAETIKQLRIELGQERKKGIVQRIFGSDK